MSLDYKLIGERLKDTRLNQGYTQEKLSEKLDVSTAYLSRIETGKAKLSLKRLSEICAILEISMGYILDGTSNNDSSLYLNKELNNILKDCSAEAKKEVYQIATIIVEKDKNKSSK